MCLGISQYISTLNLNRVTRNLLEGRFVMVGVLARVGLVISYNLSVPDHEFPQLLPVAWRKNHSNPRWPTKGRPYIEDLNWFRSSDVAVVE